MSNIQELTIQVGVLLDSQRRLNATVYRILKMMLQDTKFREDMVMAYMSQLEEIEKALEHKP